MCWSGPVWKKLLLSSSAAATYASPSPLILCPMDALEINQIRGGGVPWDLGAGAEWTGNLCSPDAGCSVQRDCAGGAERSTLR